MLSTIYVGLLFLFCDFFTAHHMIWPYKGMHVVVDDIILCYRCYLSLLVFHTLAWARVERTSVCTCHPSITHVVSPLCVSMPPFNHTCCVTSLCQTVDLATANATEEDKLRAAMDQASQYYHPSQYVPCTHTQSSTEIHYQDRVHTTMYT